MEERVWQRVFSAPAPTAEDLHPLILAAGETVADCRYLLNNPGKLPKELLRQLHFLTKSNLSCLRGLQALRFGSAGKMPNLPASGDNREKLLGKCYHRTRRCLTEYTARSADPEFGAVFQQLATREQQILSLLAELLGILS